MNGPLSNLDPAASAPHPYDGFVVEADTRAAFGLLLSRIGQQSPLDPKQIVNRSTVPRATVYRMLNEEHTAFQRNVDAVEDYCQVCGMRPEQVKQVVGLWHRLNGTLVVLDTGDVVVDAELVEPDAIVTTTASQTPAGMLTADGGHAVVVGGKIGGDVNITITQGLFKPWHGPHLAAMLRNMMLLLLVVLVSVVIVFATESPYDFAQIEGPLIVVPFIVVVVFAMGSHILTQRVARNTAASDLLRRRLFIQPNLEDWMNAPPTVRLLERILSWRSAVIATPAAVAGAIVSISVSTRNRELKLGASGSWRTHYYDDSNTAVALSGLLVGVGVLVLVTIWAATTDKRAVRLTRRHFPVLLVIAVVIGIVSAVLMANSFSTPIGGVLVVSVLVTTAILHLSTMFIRKVVLLPALKEIQSGKPDLSRYAKWMQDNMIDLTDPS